MLRTALISPRFLLLVATLLQGTRSPLFAASAGPTSEHDIALWILREGGRVLLDGAPDYIGDPFDLPAGTVHIAGVDMHGTVTDPKELGPLSQLTGVRELFLPARMWSPVSDVKAPYSDEMFDFFRGMQRLERLQAGLTTLAWLDLWDAGLQRMAMLTQLKDL
ncbi:MAG TPA: hypothetical protein VNY30_17050, partial [Bryobacteraceae bacterium]|nr:hypothetical protein [Bryobacteraceae bacterium]